MSGDERAHTDSSAHEKVEPTRPVVSTDVNHTSIRSIVLWALVLVSLFLAGSQTFKSSNVELPETEFWKTIRRHQHILGDLVNNAPGRFSFPAVQSVASKASQSPEVVRRFWPLPTLGPEPPLPPTSTSDTPYTTSTTTADPQITYNTGDFHNGKLLTTLGKSEFSLHLKENVVSTYIKTTRPIVNPGGYTIGSMSGNYVHYTPSSTAQAKRTSVPK